MPITLNARAGRGYDMPAVNGDDGLLEKALADLRGAWAATAETWRDQARADFEREHLEEIEQRTRQAVRAIRQMDTLMREAMRQCT